jgi:hypothetical protein
MKILWGEMEEITWKSQSKIRRIAVKNKHYGEST